MSGTHRPRSALPRLAHVRSRAHDINNCGGRGNVRGMGLGFVCSGSGSDEGEDGDMVMVMGKRYVVSEINS